MSAARVISGMIAGFVVVILLMIAGSGGCNFVAKKLGGTVYIKMPKDQKLVNVTWKDSDIWILTRKAKAGETQEVYEFSEKSNFGIIEGNVILTENISVAEIVLDKQIEK